MSLKEFDIQFSKLRHGVNQFEYKVDQTFFEKFEYSKIKESSIQVNLEVDRSETMYQLTFNLNGTIQLPCDRCLEPVDYPVNGEMNLILKLSDEEMAPGDEIMYIPRSEIQFNVAEQIYEYAHVLLPIRCTCEMADENKHCNEEITKKIEDLSVNKPDDSDPRWDILKDLFN